MAKVRGRTGYDNRRQTESMQGGSGIPSAVHFYDSRCPVRIKHLQPTGAGSPIVFKPCPPLDYDDADNFTAGRAGRSRSAFYEWYVIHRAVSFVGYKDKSTGKDYRVSFLLDDPNLADDQDYVRSNPYSTLYYVGKRGKDSSRIGNTKWDSDWNPLFKENPEIGELCIQKPRKLLFVQAVVGRAGSDQVVKGKKYISDFLGSRETPLGVLPDDELPVLCLSPTAYSMAQIFNVEASAETLSKRRKKFDEAMKGRKTTPEEPVWFDYEYGDPMGQLVNGPNGQEFRNGYVYVLYNPTTYNFKMSQDTTFSGTIKPQAQGFECGLVREYKSTSGNSMKGGFTPEEIKVLKNKVQFFHPDPVDGSPGLLHFPSHEEQAIMLAQAYAPVRKLLSLVWGQESYDWFQNKELQDLLNAKKGVAVPGSSLRTRAEETQDDDEGDDDDSDLLDDIDEDSPPSDNASPVNGTAQPSLDDDLVEDEDEDEEEDDEDDEPDFDGGDEDDDADDEEEDEDEDEEEDDDPDDYGDDDEEDADDEAPFDTKDSGLDEEGYDDSISDEDFDKQVQATAKPKSGKKAKARDPEAELAEDKKRLQAAIEAANARSSTRTSQPTAGPKRRNR